MRYCKSKSLILLLGLLFISVVLSACTTKYVCLNGSIVKTPTDCPQGCGNSICETDKGENHFTCKEDCNLIKDCHSNTDCPIGMKCVLVEEKGSFATPGYGVGDRFNFCSLWCVNEEDCPGFGCFSCIRQGNPKDNYCAKSGG